MSTVGENIYQNQSRAPGFGPREASLLSLIVTNAGMLLLFFILDLSLFQVIVVYWFETLWIGLFSGLRLLTASLFGDPYENRWVDVSPGAGLLMSIMAMVKSGGVFFAIFILTGVALVVAHEGLTGIPGNDFVSAQGPLLLKCSLLFAVGHGLAFVVNFLGFGEIRRARIKTLLWYPFKHSFALYLTIVAALTAIQAWPGYFNASGFAAVMILVKLAWDGFMHSREYSASSLTSRPA